MHSNHIFISKHFVTHHTSIIRDKQYHYCLKSDLFFLLITLRHPVHFKAMLHIYVSHLPYDSFVYDFCFRENLNLLY